jgi:hypothetical protein
MESEEQRHIQRVFPEIYHLEEYQKGVLGNTPLGKNRSLYPFIKLIAIPPIYLFYKMT